MTYDKIDLSKHDLLPGINRVLLRPVEVQRHNASPILRTDQTPDLIGGEVLAIGPVTDVDVELLPIKVGHIVLVQPGSAREIEGIAPTKLLVAQVHDVLVSAAPKI